jgi:hypothetical protein
MCAISHRVRATGCLKACGLTLKPSLTVLLRLMACTCLRLCCAHHSLDDGRRVRNASLKCVTVYTTSSRQVNLNCC